jgi:hypothetical protein
VRLIIVDGATASAMASILPVLLLAFTVELRRTELHRRGRRPGWLIVDVLSGLAIFALLVLLFVLALVPSRGKNDE